MGMHGDHDLGHTVAGWTGTGVGVLGSVVTGLGLVAGSPAGMLVGGALVGAAALATWTLHLAGWGKASGPRPPGRRHWRTRDTAARRGHSGCVGCRMAGRRGAGAAEVAPAALSAGF